VALPPVPPRPSEPSAPAATAAPPRPDTPDSPRIATLPPLVPPEPAETPPEQQAALPLPPPALPAPPARQPPAARQADRLPGLYLPQGPQLTPRPEPPRTATAQPRPQGLRGLDLSLAPVIGRLTPEPEAQVRGAQVGTDWRNAFRRWLEENKRYPEAAVVLRQQGTTRIEIVAAPDGRVLGARLIRRSGSVWLDANTESMFRGAVLPAFPPGADPRGVTIDLTIHYILIGS
jgi:TonB family protein